MSIAVTYNSSQIVSEMRSKLCYHWIYLFSSVKLKTALIIWNNIIKVHKVKTIQIQLSAVIMRSNMRNYCIHHCSDWSRIWIRDWIYKKIHHTCPNGQDMVCLLQEFLRRLTTLKWHRTVTCSLTVIWMIYSVLSDYCEPFTPYLLIAKCHRNVTQMQHRMCPLGNTNIMH